MAKSLFHDWVSMATRLKQFAEDELHLRKEISGMVEEYNHYGILQTEVANKIHQKMAGIQELREKHSKTLAMKETTEKDIGLLIKEIGVGYKIRHALEPVKKGKDAIERFIIFEWDITAEGGKLLVYHDTVGKEPFEG